MLLAIDIGNTNIVFGTHENKTWTKQWRIATNDKLTADDYAVIFLQLFQEAHLSFHDFTHIAMSSVVPQLTPTLEQMIKQRAHCPLKILTANSDIPLTIAIEPPSITGSDLIANAIAAFTDCQDHCIIIDFGTASTMMAVKKPGILLGGAIMPGLNTMANALVSQTSQLPQIALNLPANAIGDDSISAMQSGLVYGHISMIDGMITRMKTSLGHAKVYATGGLATTLKPHLSDIDVIDPLLTLEGLRLFACG